MQKYKVFDYEFGEINFLINQKSQTWEYIVYEQDDSKEGNRVRKRNRKQQNQTTDNKLENILSNIKQDKDTNF